MHRVWRRREGCDRRGGTAVREGARGQADDAPGVPRGWAGRRCCGKRPFWTVHSKPRQRVRGSRAQLGQLRPAAGFLQSARRLAGSVTIAPVSVTSANRPEPRGGGASSPSLPNEHSPAIFEALLDAGAEPAVRDNRGETAVDRAGSLDIFRGTHALRRLQRRRSS